MNWETLIDVARILANPQDAAGPDGSKNAARLRKAVSAAYYAMFHALAQNNADRLVGDLETDRETGAWHRTYRALDHRAAYRQLSESRLGNFSGHVKRFANAFRDLQYNRHQADYDPQSRFSPADVLNLIVEAESAIGDLLTATAAERREIAAHVLFPSRT